jgi:hypothetical protein
MKLGILTLALFLTLPALAEADRKSTSDRKISSTEMKKEGWASKLRQDLRNSKGLVRF